MSSGRSHDDRTARNRWSQAHGGVDPDASMWISGWLSIVHRFTQPLVGRSIPPSWITAVGVLVAAMVPLFAWLGAGWPLVATVWVVLSALLDGNDGALARQDDTASRWGAVVDELGDRCSDLMMLAALALLGAPWGLWVGAGVLTMFLESVRSSARVAGMGGIGVLTVWERPSRIIVAAFGTGLCGLASLVPAGDAVRWTATGAAVIAVVLASVGLLQLLVAVRRELTDAVGD